MWNFAKTGIVGYGKYGKLLANKVFPFGCVVWDRDEHAFLGHADRLAETTGGPRWAKGGMKDVAEQDVIYFAVPIRALKSAFQEFLEARVHPHHQLIINCCSVQSTSYEVITRVLSGRGAVIADFSEGRQGISVVGMHTLWGPQTVESRGGSFECLDTIVCPWQAKDEYPDFKAWCDEAARVVEVFLHGLGMDTAIMDPLRHDRLMRVHALAQMLAHLLASEPLLIGSREDRLYPTSSAQKLLDLIDFLKNDYPEPHDSICLNPYLAEMSHMILDELQKAKAHGKTFEELYARW